MRLPVPTNRLVAFTLAGAVLTAIVAVGLGAPLGGLGQSDDSAAAQAAANGSGQAASDAPTPNQQFTPAAQSGPGDEDEEHEAYEEHEEDEEHEAYEEHEDDEEWWE